MLYVCNLLRYFFVACLCSGEKWAYLAVCIHASSIAECFMDKFLWWCVHGFHIPF